MNSLKIYEVPSLFLPVMSHVDIYLSGQGHPGHSMDLISCGGCSDVLTRISIRNERFSAIGALPTVLNYETPSGTASTKDNCLAKGMPSSQGVTCNDYYKSPAPILPKFRMVLKDNPNLELLRESAKASFDTVSLLNFCLILLSYSLFFPSCWSRPNKLYILISIILVPTMHKIPFQRVPSHKPSTTFLFTFAFLFSIFPL